ncbi:hypothetical protein ACIGNX_18715 [Actinosynnema sp. NPDC053489]|uniref:hypothetical protein n=1 Tax=Actinosynnema sp. NPDC053489 TaxID=3363916 RepID=UPI0037CC68A1
MRLAPLPVPPALLAPAAPAASPTPNDTAVNRRWERNTSSNVNETATGHRLTAGAHALELWVVDPTVVVQELVVDTGGLRPSYPGPPESRRVH